jgi:hypothetical protein
MIFAIYWMSIKLWVSYLCFRQFEMPIYNDKIRVSKNSKVNNQQSESCIYDRKSDRINSGKTYCLKDIQKGIDS